MIVLPFANETEATLACVEPAIARAEVALNSTICQSMPISCRDGMYFFRSRHMHSLFIERAVREPNLKGHFLARLQH